jgi:hypothetical protein
MKGHGKKKLRGRQGRPNPREICDVHCTHFIKNGSHEENDFKFPWDKIKEHKNN